MSVNNIVKAAVFCALAIALGFALLPVPNLELITVTVFLSGLYLNAAWGLIIGSTSIFVYSGLNPMGSGLAFPPVFVSQIFCMGLIGFLGGLMKPFIYLKDKFFFPILCAVIGFSLTLIYDLVTILSYPISIGLDGPGLLGVVIKGLSFMLIHEIFNAIIFSISIPKALKIMFR